MIWTPDKEARFKKLWAAGKTTTFIAKQLGISRGSVTGKRKRMGLPMRVTRKSEEWTYAEYTKACYMHDQLHLSCSEVARRLGRGESAVRYRLHVGMGSHVPGIYERKQEPPESVLSERDDRLSVPPRTITAAIFGDPPPGYSALDRKLATLSQKEAA